jgi:phosphatidylglycerophosphate synthase
MATNREVRIQTSMLAAVEKRCLIWLAHRIPRWMNSDHLTALGAFALLAAGLCFWVGSSHPAALVIAVFLLAVNWFGDSLDGTLARVRGHERPRYGFYVDHVLDAVGILFVIGGLVLGQFMSPAIGAGFVIAYYLLTIEIALATHAVGTFRISFWKFGPTELRILLAAGTLLLLRSSDVTIFGRHYLLFDVGGLVGIVSLLTTFVISAVINTRLLFRTEPLPGRNESRPKGLRYAVTKQA